MLLFFLLLFTLTEAYPHCEQILHLNRGQVRRVPSPGYPDIDRPGTHCRWTVRAPEDLGIVFSCPFPNRTRQSTKEFHPEFSGSCHGKFQIEPNAENNTELCTGTPFTRTANTNRMVINYMVPEGKMDLAFICYVHTTLLDTNETTIHAYSGGLAELPCNIKHSWDSVSIVDWDYVEKDRAIYSLSASDNSLESGTYKRHSDIFGNRTSMRVAGDVAYLIVSQVRENDAGHYKCRLYYKHNAPQKSSIVLLKVGEQELPEQYDGCDYDIHLEWGKPQLLQTYNYPNEHPANRNCRWKVDSSFGSRIQLSCGNALHMGNDSCRFLSLYKTGEFNHNSRTGLKCTSPVNSETSYDSQMLITYTGDKEPVAPFMCNLTATCDQTMHLDSNFHANGVKVETPDYPLLIPKGEACRWTVESTPGTRISMKCPHNSQTFDCPGWVHILSDGDTAFQKYSLCGGKRMTQYSMSNKVVLEFGGVNEDYTSPFFCHFSVEQTNNGDETAVSSTNEYTGCKETIYVNYGQTAKMKWKHDPNPTDRLCRWTLDARLDAGILVSCVKDSDMGHSPQEICTRLELNEVSNISPTRNITLCPGGGLNLYSEATEIVVTFNQSSPSFTCDFQLHCNRIIYLKNNDKGIKIKSPNFPQVVPAGLSCRYIINSPPETKILISCPSSNNYPKEMPCKSWFEVSPTGEDDHIVSVCRHEGFAQYSEGNTAFLKHRTADQTKNTPRYVCYLSVEPLYLEERGQGSIECNCGRKNTARIMGGQDTSVNEYTMMACLMDHQSNYLCGASIIAEHYALTTASCAKERPLETTRLIVGEFDHSDNVMSDPRRVHAIKKIILHPGWATNWKDISLVQTTAAINFNRYVAPACLPFSNRNTALIGETVHAVGWGQSRKSDKPLENVLQEADLLVADEAKCGYWFKRQSFKAGFHNMMFCTYSAGKRLCPLDAGGPILWLDPVIHQYKVVGVIAPTECGSGEEGNVHTRVSSFLDWIEKNTKGTTFCKK